MKIMGRNGNISRLCVCALAGLAFVHTVRAFAEAHWIKARLGSFEAISDDGRKPATQALSQFEQFSFALGTAMGKPDLRLDPPLRIIVFKNAQELESQCSPPLRMGRDRLMACTTSEGQLPHALLRDLTRTLLEQNFGSMPGPIETAIETFFSTVESNAVHVTWGAPPPVAERTREWALIHRIITQPDYSGKARIYLHNLAAGMDTNAASRNAFGEDAKKFEAEVDQYYAAGMFNAAAAPSRPLNPERDFNTTVLTSDEGELMRADLLTSASTGIYESLVKAGKDVAEADEGLAALAMHNNDSAQARSYMEAARKAGTKNFVLLTEYATLEPDSTKAVAILKEALTIEPKYAKAHWIFGEKLTDPPRRMMEWKQAVNLAPRNYKWWEQYAQLCIQQKQYPEAARAWVAAAQAAPDAASRERYLTARGQIEGQRLDAEDAERRAEAEAKAREIEHLKDDARKELADFEAKANTNPLSQAEAEKAVSWFDDSASASITGTLVRIICTGKQFMLNVKGDDGKVMILSVRDPSKLVIEGGGTALSCGAQKPRRAKFAYNPVKDSHKGILGEATAVEFEP